MKRAVLVFIALGFPFAIVAILVAGSLLSAPAHVRIGAPPPDLDARPVEFESVPDVTIRGWLAQPTAPSRASVILLPGVRANRLSMVDRARFLVTAGYTVLLVDHQGTGESDGDRITFGWRERNDVIAARRFLRSQYPETPVAVIGSSLGGAAAVLAGPDLQVEALILEAVYPSIDAAVQNRLGMRGGSIAALSSPLLTAQLRLRIGAGAGALRPVDWIATVGCPVLIIGGDRDRHTTAADTRRLYEAARQPKSLWMVPGAAHVDLHRKAGAEYEKRILAFLESALHNAPR